jgi:chromosome segregation ATPase
MRLSSNVHGDGVLEIDEEAEERETKDKFDQERKESAKMSIPRFEEDLKGLESKLEKFQEGNRTLFASPKHEGDRRKLAGEANHLVEQAKELEKKRKWLKEDFDRAYSRVGFLSKVVNKMPPKVLRMKKELQDLDAEMKKLWATIEPISKEGNTIANREMEMKHYYAEKQSILKEIDTIRRHLEKLRMEAGH